MVASPLQLAKRAFVSLLLALGRQYSVVLSVNRDSPEQAVWDSFRKVSKKVHPDKGGDKDDMRKLLEAKEKFEKASAAKTSQKDSPESALSAPASKMGFRIHSTAVLLTYSGIKDLDHWRAFLGFVAASVGPWGVWRWCATLETSKAGNQHAHLMLESRSSRYVS